MHRRHRRHLAVIGIITMAVAPSAHAQQRQAMTIQDFLALPTVGDPQLSPDGLSVTYTVTTVSLDQNRNMTRLWLATRQSGETRQLTQGPGSDRAPRWAPDGRSIAFISSREEGPQIWVLSARGGEARKVSSLPDGVTECLWMPDGRGFLAVSDVSWPKEREIDRRNEAYPTDARLWTGLMWRHWDEFRAGKRQHLFAVDLETGAAQDLTPLDHDVPTIATAGAGDVAVSPDGKEIAVAFHGDSVVADNTNVDVYVMAADGSDLHPVTAANQGADNTPRFSPDGKWLSYLSMARPGFESDRLRLMLMARTEGRTTASEPVEATAGWSLSVGSYTWCPDSRCIYAVVEERGRDNIYRIDIPSYQRRAMVARNGVNTSLSVASSGGTVAYLHQSNTQPAEVWTLDGGTPRQLTHATDSAATRLDLNPLEEFGFVGARGDSVFGWTQKPPGFDPSRRYPLVYLIHGGPQGAWVDNWHARWNYQMFAARGYVIAAVNFHGSTGYGQAFTDAISQHWGDYPLEDLMRGLDQVNRLSYVDSARTCAAGASYGGYMVYWLEGHTNRFRCLVDHDGVFNTVSMAGSTEELWFPYWEFGGSPYANRDLYEKWSPLNFVKNWKTPMLIIHSQLDYRVDLSQGYQAFTALKTMGLPGKFLYFPDEGHWVLKPRNRRLWWGVVLDWLDDYLKKNAGGVGS